MTSKFLLIPILFIAMTSCAEYKFKNIVLLAGIDSHGEGAHEFTKGCQFLGEELRNSGLPVNVTVVEERNWPESLKAFDEADAIVIYADGGGKKHPLERQKLFERFTEYAASGKGLGFMHYACEVAEPRGSKMLEWVGGYYHSGFSTNPHWTCNSILNRDHPATRGVEDFSVLDEWYFNIKLGEGVVSVLSGIPDDEARMGKTSWPRGPHKHIVDASGQTETLLWTLDREDGGRGFGFTGGHFHHNWQDAGQRKLVLNTIVWLADLEVPANGVK